MVEMIKEKIRSYTQNKFSFPIILFLITFLTYGLLSPWMRFFHDEYSILLFHQRMNDVSLFFEGNRPFLAYIYKPLLTIFGSNYFYWFLFGITTRWFHALCLFFLIKEIWSDDQYLSVTASLFCLIFPAFQAQFAFMIFGILFLLFSFFLLSLKFSLMALKGGTNKTALITIALVFSFINLVTSEYFFTLEILRYLILGFYLANKDKQNWVKKFIRESMPYLLLFFALSVWRFSQQSAETTYAFNKGQQLSSVSFSLVFNFLNQIMTDVWNVSFGAWLYALYPRHLLENLSDKVFMIFFIISVSIGIICFLLLRHSRRNNHFTKIQHITIFTFSITAIFSAGIPFWIAKLPIGEFYMFSRWTIPFMPGISILFAWLFHSCRNRQLANFVCALLIALGAGNQLLIANSFRHDWNKQQAYFWQFKWRIPTLQENTTIFSNMLGFDYENSDEISGALNFFQPDLHDQTIPIFQFYLPERAGTALLPEIRSGIPLLGRRYYDSFRGNSSQIIIIDFQYPSCFKVLDPEIDIFNPSIDTLLKEALFLADNALILDEQPYLNTDQIEHIFGKQPEPDWCYYFEKAELARQVEDWDQVRIISNTVKELGLYPRDQREWFPFIEGYTQNGNWDEAVSLTESIYEQSPQYSQMLQTLWSRINMQTYDSQEKKIAITTIGRLIDES
ncbi:MAG: hypothetical protein Q7J07_05820 [Pelolinea sp.]|nr:hypothetical protein [Pelolinea sp.]